MNSFIGHFKGSFLFTAIALVFAGYVGYIRGGIVNAIFITLILGVLEISLSFDNAVVNAKVLKDMTRIWQQRFLTWGIAIAVFGMRVVFPLLIVMTAAKIGPIDTITLAINKPEEYERLLKGAHHEIVAFGGSFLLMVGLRYFFDKSKEVHWIKFIEKPLAKYGKLYLVEMILVMVLLIISTFTFPLTELEQDDGYHKRLIFLIAGLLGLIVYGVVQWVEVIMEDEEHEHANLATSAAKAGLASFIYLEVLDASFSFDGVIGAFALSNNIFIIALGLGIGAMFVRSLTVMLVEREAMAQYRYLENGAFWAIIALGLMMFLDLFMHVSEVITGLLGAFLIGLSVISSILANKGDDKKAKNI